MKGLPLDPWAGGRNLHHLKKHVTACVKEVERQSFDYAVEDVLPEILTQVRTCGIVVTL